MVPAVSGKRRWPKWLMWALAGLVGLVAVAVVAVILLTRDPSPDEFYAPPDDVPAQPGTVIRSEPFTAGIPAGARAWRVLYSSTDPAGKPIAVSGLVIAPTDPPAGPRPILAWSHGTVGITSACAPSLAKKPLEGIPDMTGPLANGWVLTLTDYQGLGTPGPHPYLVGESEGRAVLDSVRAAHQFDLGVPLDDRYVIWGHSQGGHAALFAGQLAPSYLPEYPLAGVAALAPATDLQDNFAAIQGTPGGNILTVFALAAWSHYYPEISDEILTSDARRPAERVAGSCVNQPSRLLLLAAGNQLPERVVDIDVAADPAWSARLAENSPDPAGIAAPLFVAQGLTDELISPAVTTAWVDRRCAAGDAVEFRTYPGVTHPVIIGPGGRDALAWTTARFAGEPAPDTCSS